MKSEISKFLTPTTPRRFSKTLVFPQETSIMNRHKGIIFLNLQILNIFNYYDETQHTKTTLFRISSLKSKISLPNSTASLTWQFTKKTRFLAYLHATTWRTISAKIRLFFAKNGNYTWRNMAGRKRRKKPKRRQYLTSSFKKVL